MSAKEVSFNIIECHSKVVPETRKLKIDFFQRKSRIREDNQRVSTESRSLHRDKFCEKCGLRGCKCRELELSEIETPNNLSKSISGGFSQYQTKNEGHFNRMNTIGMGFINVNKIVNRDTYRNI